MKTGAAGEGMVLRPRDSWLGADGFRCGSRCGHGGVLAGEGDVHGEEVVHRVGDLGPLGYTPRRPVTGVTAATAPGQRAAPCCGSLGHGRHVWASTPFVHL